MKTTEQVLTEIAQNEIHFDAGIQGRTVWTRDKFQILVWYLAGQIVSREAIDMTPKMWDQVAWSWARRVRTLFQNNGWEVLVTVPWLAKHEGLWELDVVYGEGKAAGAKRAATTKFAATGKTQDKVKPKGPEPTKPTTNPQE